MDKIQLMINNQASSKLKAELEMAKMFLQGKIKPDHPNFFNIAKTTQSFCAIAVKKSLRIKNLLSRDEAGNQFNIRGTVHYETMTNRLIDSMFDELIEGAQEAEIKLMFEAINKLKGEEA